MLRNLKTAGVLACSLFAAGTAHAVPIITDWTYSLDSIWSAFGPAPSSTQAQGSTAQDSRAPLTFSRSLVDAGTASSLATSGSSTRSSGGASASGAAIGGGESATGNSTNNDAGTTLENVALPGAVAPAGARANTTGSTASGNTIVAVVAPAPALTAAATEQPVQLSSQLSLWSSQGNADASHTSFVGAPALASSLTQTPVSQPAANEFPLANSALNGLPTLTGTSAPPTSLASGGTRALPEPGMLALLGLGLLGVAGMRRRTMH